MAERDTSPPPVPSRLPSLALLALVAATPLAPLGIGMPRAFFIPLACMLVLLAPRRAAPEVRVAGTLALGAILAWSAGRGLAAGAWLGTSDSGC